MEPKSLRVATRIRVLYKPRAGKVKAITIKLDSEGMGTINGAKHTFGENALVMWRGKRPWACVHQGHVAAVPWTGQPDAFTPQFLNEVVSNHYASDVLSAVESYDDKKKTGEIAMMVMVGAVLLFVLVFGIVLWVKMDGMTNLINFLQTQQAQAHQAMQTNAQDQATATATHHA